MNKRMITMLGASALVIGGAAAGIASANDRHDAEAAAAGAARAGKALARHDGHAAIAAAEGAVALAPRQADYRVLLGQSYLAAGRFVSARAAFADALSLAPTDPKAALNLVLAQIATGDWAGARRNLDEHGAVIAPADRGLALALAGDPNGAVQMLTQVARSADNSPKVRQNLALSLALAGQWQAARAVAAVDVSPADLDARLEQWAAFARPRSAADQVATLLGVTPVEDAGQPAQLALSAQSGIMVAAVPAAPPALVEPAPVAASPLPTQLAAAAPGITFGPRAEVVQPIRDNDRQPVAARVLHADVEPIKIPLASKAAAGPVPAPSHVAAAKGSWFVQFGAFQSSAVAHDAWRRISHRLPAVATATPNGADFTMNSKRYYRLSVGGFSRGDADATCHRYRAIGGDCFVRAGAGDQIASWAKKSVQVAAR